MFQRKNSFLENQVRSLLIEERAEDICDYVISNQDEFKLLISGFLDDLGEEITNCFPHFSHSEIERKARASSIELAKNDLMKKLSDKSSLRYLIYPHVRNQFSHPKILKSRIKSTLSSLKKVGLYFPSDPKSLELYEEARSLREYNEAIIKELTIKASSVGLSNALNKSNRNLVLKSIFPTKADYTSFLDREKTLKDRYLTSQESVVIKIDNLYLSAVLRSMGKFYKIADDFYSEKSKIESEKLIQELYA